jgi:hypothetical protein
VRRVRHGDATLRVLALHQPFLQCGNSGSGGEPWRRRKPALHLWRRNEKDVPDPRFSLFGFSSRRNSCSGRAFALHPFTLQNERRIDHGDFFPSSRLRVPEGAHLALTSRRCPDVWPALLCAAMLLLFPGSSCSMTRCRIHRRQTSPQALVGSIFVAFSLLRTFFLVPDSPLG